MKVGAAWAKSAGSRASHGTFTDSAAFGELLFNCTKGEGSLGALIDISNALDGSKGFPPTLAVANTDSRRDGEPPRARRYLDRLPLRQRLGGRRCCP